MKTRIKQWESSAVVCLDEDVLEKMSLKVGDMLNIEVVNGAIMLRPDSLKYAMSELLANSRKSNFLLSDDDKVWLNSTIGREPL